MEIVLCAQHIIQNATESKLLHQTVRFLGKSHFVRQEFLGGISV